MSEDEQSSPDGGTEGVADRVELRRIQLGLSPSELAHRARMSTSYLRELASLRGDFDPEGLTRLAEALDMTSDELLHGRADPPPGQTNAGAHQRLMRLTERECWDRLGTHGVGRLGLRGIPRP